MSLPTEIAQQQINLIQYPEKFRQPFLEALNTKRLVLIDKEINSSQLIEYAVPFLNANPSITTLNVLINRIGNMGAKALALNTTLRTLDVSLNQIDDAGAQALTFNTTLRTLDVSANRIGDAGIQALALNTTLSMLRVTGNEIGDASRSALLAANQSRKDICDRQNLAFLSVMTLTKDQTFDDQKQQTLLFKFRKGINTINNNRLGNELVAEILSYNKPKPFQVIL